MQRQTARNVRHVLFAVTAVIATGACSNTPAPSTAGTELAYVGCANMTGTIFTFAIDPASGQLTMKSKLETGSAVSFATFHPSKKYFYVNHRMVDQVDAYAVDPATGALTLLNSVTTHGIPGSMRAGPVFVTVDKAGKYLFVAEYQGSNVLVYSLGADGKIGALVAMDSAGMNAHMVQLDPANKFALVPYWGSDIVAQYRFDQATGALTPNTPPSVPVDMGSGPRHMDFHPNGKWVYLVSEKGGTVTAFNYDADKGTIAKINQVSIMPAGFADMMGPFSSHVAVAPSGKFVYSGDRRAAIAVALSIDQTSGAVALVDSQSTHGMTPRDFSLDPSGSLLIAGNQDSKSVVVFSVDKTSGKLTFLPDRTQDNLCDLPFFVRTIAM